MNHAHSIRWLTGVAALALFQGDALAQDARKPAPTTGDAAIAQAQGTRLNTTGKTIDIVVPLRERVPIGQVEIRIAPGDSVTISQRDLANAIRRGVTPQFVAAIEAIPSVGGFVTAQDVAAHGMLLAFDPSALELTAKFDPSAFPEQSIGLGFDTATSAVEPDRSANFAALLSYQASVDWVHQGIDTGLHKPRVNFNFDGRLFHRIAFENEFTYDGDQSPSFTRFGSRAFYDIPTASLRLGAGDLVPENTALQGQVDISGIGISKLLDTFHADRVYTASAGQRLTLREPATVTVVINGAPSQTLRLTPGSYNIRDLPLTGGANKIDLVIEDEAGGRRVVSFDFFEDISLLAPGVDQYDAKVGIRSDVEDASRIYYRHEPVFSGYYRRGISNQLTLGANAQATKNVIQGGGEVSWGSPFGLFTFEGSASRLKGVGTGTAARLQYRYSMPMELSLGSRRFDALLEYHSRNFAGIDESAINPYSIAFTGRYFQPINRDFGAGVGVDYRKGRDGTDDQKAIRADASYRLHNGMNFTGSAGYDSRDGLVFGLSLFWRLGRESVVTARYDSRRQDASVAYYHDPVRLLDSLAYGIEGTHSEGGRFGVNGTAIYRTNRGDLELAHRESFGPDSVDREAITSLRARGTIAFADGKFAAGRYLTDAFAIVSAHPSLDGAQVLIGSQVAADAEARTDAFGPALVALGSYAHRSLYYTVPDAPLGYDFGTGSVELYPWFHAGLAATIGSEFNVSILGTLLDESGQPLALAAGSAHRVGDKTSPTVEIYTNRQGRLGASGLAPGEWVIDAGGKHYVITIPKSAGSLLDVGSVRPAQTGDRP